MKAAVYTGTRNIYKGMVPAIKSILINSDVQKIYLLIEDDQFPIALPKEVECINVSNQTYFKSNGANMNSAYTYMAMMRAALTKVLPTSLDRVLSLDYDTIVNQDISDLWELPLDNYYFAASKQPHKTDQYLNIFYTNTGVALYNLKLLRETKKDDEIIQRLNTFIYPFVQQDCYNELCQNHILEMSSDYNVNPWTLPTNNPKIIHFAGESMNKWYYKQIVQKYLQIPFSKIRNKNV